MLCHDGSASVSLVEPRSHTCFPVEVRPCSHTLWLHVWPFRHTQLLSCFTALHLGPWSLFIVVLVGSCTCLTSSGSCTSLFYCIYVVAAMSHIKQLLSMLFALALGAQAKGPSQSVDHSLLIHDHALTSQVVAAAKRSSPSCEGNTSGTAWINEYAQWHKGNVGKPGAK